MSSVSSVKSPFVNRRVDEETATREGRGGTERSQGVTENRVAVFRREMNRPFSSNRPNRPTEYSGKWEVGF